MTRLPQIQSNEEYSAVFYDSEIWFPAIAQLALNHRLKGDPVRGVLGSNIVYRVGNYWIKLFAPFFEKEFEMELVSLELASQQSEFTVPLIYAKGVFDGWSYMVISHVEGIRIGDVWSKISDVQRASLAKDIATVTLSLQKLKAPAEIAQRYNWNQFMRERFDQAVSMQVKKGLSQKSTRKLESFISNFSVDGFLCDDPVYLHADLTHDHFLINDEGTSVIGVIDFADSMIGHPEYDLIAYFCYLFHGYKDAQMSFYRSWGNRVSPERMLMWILLHRFSDLNRYFGLDAFDQFSNFTDFAQEKFV